MANFVNSKKYRTQQFILRKSAGSQLFAAFLENSEIGREIIKIIKIIKKYCFERNFEINGKFLKIIKKRQFL
jgi:hypothetical protein